jgi:integrase
VGHLLREGSNLKRSTVKRLLSSLSSLWGWLEDRGLAERDSNPWLRQLRGKREKRGDQPKRKQWADVDLPKLLNGEATPRFTQTLHDFIRLALVTGARLDELCSLKRKDAEKLKDGWWITIQDGKTDAAERKVPIHDSVAHVINRRKALKDEHLFPGLITGGPNNKRSWYVSKPFGRYCAKLGFNDEGLVFHSLRKTFIEAMEAANVPEATVKLLVGHKRGSITYGLYSKGERLKLRQVIQKLKYSRPVMRAIRKSSGT